MFTETNMDICGTDWAESQATRSSGWAMGKMAAKKTKALSDPHAGETLNWGGWALLAGLAPMLRAYAHGSGPPCAIRGGREAAMGDSRTQRCKPCRVLQPSQNVWGGWVKGGGD